MLVADFFHGCVTSILERFKFVGRLTSIFEPAVNNNVSVSTSMNPMILCFTYSSQAVTSTTLLILRRSLTSYVLINCLAIVLKNNFLCGNKKFSKEWITNKPNDNNGSAGSFFKPYSNRNLQLLEAKA
jgi:hypothetical protein